MQATPEQRHLVYSFLLTHCLEQAKIPFRQQQRLRGWLPEGALYFVALIPGEERKLIIAQELSQIATLEGIAGFYFEDELWRLNIPQMTGFLIPHFNRKLQIQGLQIFKNLGDEKSSLLTSRDFPKGAKAIPAREQKFV
jgi:hypothetical protein